MNEVAKGVPGAGGPDLLARLGAALAARINAGEYKVPLLPQVASQVIALAGSPDVDASKLSALIHRDPALAGQVLRIANSPAYAPRMPIVSLQQAVARLGLAVLNEIAFAASLQSGTFKVPGYEAELERLWRHALATGSWAKEIARIRRTNVESAYLCGLLHGVGRPAILQLAVDVARGLGGQLDRAWLPPFYDQHETALGRRIAETWQLPAPVLAAVAYHARHREATAFTYEVMTTCLAHRLATWSVETEALDEQAVREHPVIADLNLYPEDVSALLAKKGAVVAAVAALTVSG